jgi:tRNA(Ile)-lysidine synthase
VRARLNHSAALLREDADLLRPLVDDALAICRSEAGLSLQRLRALSPPLQAHVLRAWLQHDGHTPPGAEALREFLRQLAEHTPDDDTRLDGPGYRIALWAGNLHLRPDSDAAHAAAFDRLWDGRMPLRLPRGGELAWAGEAPFPVRVRYRLGGERIRLPGRDMHHSVKKLLSERVPPWERAALPFVYNDDGELLAVGEVLVSAVLDDLSRRHGIRLRWHPAASPT